MLESCLSVPSALGRDLPDRHPPAAPQALRCWGAFSARRERDFRGRGVNPLDLPVVLSELFRRTSISESETGGEHRWQASLFSAWPEHHVKHDRRHRDQSHNFQNERALHAPSTETAVARSSEEGLRARWRSRNVKPWPPTCLQQREERNRAGGTISRSRSSIASRHPYKAFDIDVTSFLMLTNQIPVPSSNKKDVGMPLSENEKVKLELKILRYRRLARQIAADPDTARRIRELIADLERQLREIDE